MEQQKTVAPRPAASDTVEVKTDSVPVANEAGTQNEGGGKPRRLAAGEWLRAVMGFEAPFGRDGLPTVWG